MDADVTVGKIHICKHHTTICFFRAHAHASLLSLLHKCQFLRPISSINVLILVPHSKSISPCPGFEAQDAPHEFIDIQLLNPLDLSFCRFGVFLHMYRLSN